MTKEEEKRKVNGSAGDEGETWKRKKEMEDKWLRKIDKDKGR